ncbi:HAD-IA family hydrolase [Brevibacillus fulvus]|uniref:HAD superfamily hydrolase (TIGR01549 family) n=1 Tax=Brevibacillus fulvus TaxID=1125967 RepID=A0A938Y4Q0_9BACL|nr:HAD-IA family hydrolase [Brevibacillus fulvus]MBM7591906.1 HAD superfamily hydrolase (TIGR01549 family) [Brevibacillus fulvus]
MAINQAVFFDMDGTLLQSEKLAVPAFRKTFADLIERGHWNKDIPDEQEFTNVLGMTISQLWDRLLPGANEQTKKLANQLMLENEIILLKQGYTDLYPDVREVLTELKERGLDLFVASNGLENYIAAICDYFQITGLFTDLYSAGRFATKSKNELVARLISDYTVNRAVMVGDRHSDVEAGKTNGLFTIGCDFGFAQAGELDGADVVVQRFAEIPEKLPF